MAGITQTIPNYGAGSISEQPDQLKRPGQVIDSVNVIPDLVYGLYKRPGSKRIGSSKLATNKYGESSIPSGGSWFHYYRDATEGSYIGQVDSGGKIRIWSCNDGTEKSVWYVTDNTVYNGATAAHTSITSYLTPSPSSDSEDIQALTINDTTFITNRSKVVATTGTTTARPNTYFAYLDLLRTENGRQYAINVYSNETTTTLKRATRVKIIDDDLGEGNGTAKCQGIGTQVFGGTETNTGSRTNLTFRLNILGQQGRMNDGHATPTGDAFTCAYNRKITLLHGGEDWETNDTTPALAATGVITMDQSGGASSGGSPDQYSDAAEYQIKVTDHEEVITKGYINGGFNGVIRPAPTPFDADTAVTADTILGSIVTELSGTGITATVIGTGIYLSSSSAFNIEVLDRDLMNVMQGEVNDVAKLPIQCKDGYIVKVSNTQQSNEDDYYLKFKGENNQDGTGSWVECPEPGIVKSFDASTMPHILERQSDGEFLVKQATWADREVGDNTTNPIPTFVGKTVNKVIFFRNRLAFLSGESVICCRPGTVDEPNFWAATALAVSAVDPVDISASSSYPSDLMDALEINAGLLVFAENTQFLLSSDDTIFNPDTAKLRKVTTYNYNKVIPPISLGSTIAFIDNSGKYSKFNEVANIAREGEPLVVEQSKLVPSLLNKNIDLLTNSQENGIVLFGRTDTDTVYGYKYFGSAERRQQASWFKWEHNNPIKYHFIIDDTYYFLDNDNFLQSINLIQATSDPSVDVNSVNYLLHLDNYSTIQGGSYNSTTKLTTFTHGTESCVFDWQSDVTDGNGTLALIDSNEAAPRVGRYAEATVTSAGATFTVPGNWEYSEEWVVAYTAVNASNEQITLTTGSTDHGLETGDLVRWVEGDSAASGLTDGNIYYVIDASINNIALASSLSNANSGVAINITAQGTGNHKVRRLTKDLHIGYLYEYSVQFPTIYPTRVEGQNVRSDVNSSLVIHRIKLNFGKIGLYETTLSRVGKVSYSEVYESTDLDEYDVSDAPYLSEKIKTIPVYEKNTNVGITLKSKHPAPATLHSMSWEGDFTQKNYRRA
mgnify:CR=1 FL=1